MPKYSWSKEVPFAITVCDKNGLITEMNEKSCQTFAKDGGPELIGKNVLDCHPERAREKLAELLKSGSTNCYTIEKNGIKKLIYQAPCYQDGELSGFVELSLEIPFVMPHFVRK